MKISNFHLVLCMAIVTVISGCGSMIISSDKESIIGEPFISAEIQKESTGNFDNNGKSIGSGGQLENFHFNFVIHKNEDLRSAMSRFSDKYNYSRLIVDLSKESIRPSKIIINKNSESKANSLNEMSQKLMKDLNLPFKNALFHEARDGEKKSLVFSDRGYAPEATLNVHNVRVATIMENSREIAEFYGWKLAKNAWQLPVHYKVKYPYPLVSQDLISAMSRLFERYPAQAQLMQSTNQVMFTSRQQPVNM